MNYENLFRLDGRRAVVLGGGSGIGREAARALSAHGADVVVADRDIAAARETGVGEAYEIDLLEPGAVDRAASDLGPLDVVVLTAATNVRKRLLDYTRDEFDRVLALNLGVTFEVVRAFGADMVARGRGASSASRRSAARPSSLVRALMPQRKPGSSSCSGRPPRSSARPVSGSTRSPPASSRPR